jgi:hypothetical protein
VDLKSPYISGHSRAVAVLAAGAGRQRGLPVAECLLLKRAGLLHDLGRLGVPNVIWDNPGTLSRAEFERVRLYPYLTERILARPAPLHRIGALAALHRERLDGSGYPHGFHGVALSPSARILAVADMYPGKREPRPYRPALSAAAAADTLRIEVKAGRLDGQAVDAVLAAAGHPVRRRREWPAGLTPREVEILAMTARGCSDRDRAAVAHCTQDGAQPRRAHLRQDRRVHPGRHQPVRDAARTARPPRGRSTKMRRMPHDSGGSAAVYSILMAHRRRSRLRTQRPWRSMRPVATDVGMQEYQ